MRFDRVFDDEFMGNLKLQCYDSRKEKLLLTTVDILEKSTHQGFIVLENYFKENKHILDDKIYDYYKIGIELIQKGRTPKQLSLVMECEKMKWIRDDSNSEEDLQLITIIQNVLPCIQEGDLTGFSDLTLVVVSKEKHNEIQELLFHMKPYFWDESLRYLDMFVLSLKYKDNFEENYLQHLKNSFCFNDFEVRKNYNFEGYNFDCFMESKEEEIFIDIFLPRDNRIKNRYDIIEKIDCFKNYISYKQNKKVTILMGTIYNEVHDKDGKIINTQEEFIDLIINNKVNNILESNKECLMIINKDCISFEEAYFVHV